MTPQEVKELSAKLDVLIRLAALSLVRDKTQREQYVLLSSAGFQPKDIADIVGTTPNAVRVALSNIRRQKKRR